MKTEYSPCEANKFCCIVGEIKSILDVRHELIIRSLCMPCFLLFQTAMHPRLILPCLPAAKGGLDSAKLFVAARMCGVEITEETNKKDGSLQRLELSEYDIN